MRYAFSSGCRALVKGVHQRSVSTHGTAVMAIMNARFCSGLALARLGRGTASGDGGEKTKRDVSTLHGGTPLRWVRWFSLPQKMLALAGLMVAGIVAAQPPDLASAELETIPVKPLYETSDDESAELEAIVVIGRRNPGSPEPTTPSATTGLDGATHTQPLSVVSLTREDIAARGARDLTQAIASIAAINTPPPIFLQAANQYDLRGFGATVLFDGFSNFTLYGDRDSLAGVERIDVVKGPGSALNGAALGLPPGGVIDIHSAWPGAKQTAHVAYARSAFDQQELLVELDSGDLLPVVSFGVAAERGEGRSFFDFSSLNNQKVRPMLSLRALGGRASFYYENSFRTSKDHPGLPTTGTLDTSRFAIPDSRSVNDPDVPLSRTKLKAWGFDGTLPLGPWFTLDAAARKAISEVSQSSQYVSSNAPDTDPTALLAPSTFNRMAATYNGGNSEVQARARLTGRANLSGLGRVTGWLGYGGGEVPDIVELRAGVATPLDLANPRYGRWSGAPIPFSEAFSHFSIRNQSAGMQWRYGRWLNAFWVGTRTRGVVDNRQTSVAAQTVGDLLGEQAQTIAEGLLFPILATGPAAGTGLFVLRRDDYDLIARQFGAAVRLWDAQSSVEDDGLWAFYGQGDGHQFRAYFTGEGQPLPELSSQRETGLRLVNARFGRLEATAFRIQRRNVPTLDPNGLTGFEQVTTGLQSVRGVDVEATLRLPYPVIDRVGLNVSAAWLSSRIDEDTTFPAGNQLPDVPRHNARVQLAAELLRGRVPLSAFVTHRCRSAVQGSLANDFAVPGYCLSDAGATLRYRDFTLDTVVNNLADARYYEPYAYLFNGVIPGEGRSLRLALAYNFGRSLSSVSAGSQ